jgi:hypothetical protein
MIKELLDGGQTINRWRGHKVVCLIFLPLPIHQRSSNGEQYLNMKTTMSQQCTNNSNKGSKYVFSIKFLRHWNA